MSFIDPYRARTIRNPEQLGATPFFNRGRSETLRALIEPHLNPDGTLSVSYPDPRVVWEWNNRVMARPANYQPRGPLNPFYLNEHYGGGDPNTAMVDDEFTAAVDLAVRWAVMGDYAAGAAAVRIVDAWSRVTAIETNAGSTLNFTNHWPIILEAALMVGDHPEYTRPMHKRLEGVTTLGLASADLIGGIATNNLGAWANCYTFAAAVFLIDHALFERAIIRWRTLFDYAVVNNVPVEEVHRQSSGQGDGSFGLWYSNFFLYGMVAAAEWARFGGAWLYDYKSNTDRSTFKDFAMQVRTWTRYPETFPYNTSGTPSGTARILAHDDVLQALWPTPDGAWLLANFPTGSIRDVYGLRGAVLAYRDRPLYG